MDAIPDSDFLTEQEKEDAKRETNVEFIKAYNARSFAYPKTVAVKSAKDIRAFAEDKLVAKSFTEMRCELPGAPRSTFLMVFSPDGTKVASTHGNHNIYVSDVRTGKNIKTLMGHPRTPWCIAFHPTSNQIVASGCLGGQVRIWDLSGGSEVWSSDNSTVIASLTFHPEDRLLVIATYNQLHFWDWSKPEPFATVSTATTKEKVRYVAFDPLGHKLITGISNNTTPQSRWERAQRCSPSPSGILATRHYHNTNNTSSTAHTSPPTQHPPSTIIVNSQQPAAQPFSNIPTYNGRSQRARLTSRILAHYRAFPPRSGPDAHLYQTMFSSPTSSPSIDSVQYGNQSNSLAERDEFSDSRLDVFGDRLASSSPSVFSPAVVPTSLPGGDLRYSYGSRRTATPTPAGNTSGWMVRGNRAGVRVDSPLMQDATTNVNTQQHQSLANESSIMNPLATSRREPLSSVPDRERRISACYRNLVREYEQLVHRYLQIYRPPVMIDRGTDPMDLGYHLDNQQQPVTASTSRARTVNNPADIQPVSSNHPTDMRAVCEFTTTDPSVLSPLRNHEVEAARRNSADYRDDNRSVPLARRQTNRTEDEVDNEQSPCRGVPTQTSDLNCDDGTSTSAGTAEDSAHNNTSSNSTISVMLKNVKQALTSLRSNLDENINSSTIDKSTVVKTYVRLNNHNSQTDASTTPNQTIEEQPAENAQMTDNINLESTSAADITSADATATNENTNQDEVNDLITNLTIISSMAVQLKSVAERLTLHKDNEEKNKTNTDNAVDDGALAGTSQATANLTEASETVAESASEAINVAADIKLAKKMVDKIVQIMNTFSTNSQPSTSGENSENASRKRPHANLAKSKSNRKPILVDSSDSSNSSEADESPTKRPCLNVEADAPANRLDNTANELIHTSSDEDNSNSTTERQLNEEHASTTTAVDNASDTTSISMYNNVAADDIASTSDFAERRPWNYNRELEQLVTDLLHDNNDSNNAPDDDNATAVTLAADAQHTLCSVCGDTLGTCTANECRNNDTGAAARRAEAPSERRRRFFCHRLSAFHPTRVQTRLRNQRIRYSLAASARSDYLLPLQDPALDEVINFSQRSSEQETPDANQPATIMRTQYFSGGVEESPSFSARLRRLFRSPVNDELPDESPANGRARQTFEPPVPTYHPFDPPPELDTINPEHIGIGNMYSNIVQELETSLSDIRNIRSQRRLGETSDMLSNFSERLESIMTQSHAILRNLSTSIDSMPPDQNGQDSAPGAQQQRIGARGTNTAGWSAANRDGDLSSSSVNGNRNPAANPHAVNADHSYPRPTHNMSPLMASLHLTVSHIWRQARLLRTQMDSIERIDRAMLELAQLRVMRQMFADLSRYFSAGALNVEPGQDTGRHHRASNAPDQNSTTDDATDTNTTPTANSDNTTVNSMREMMAGTRISDNTDDNPPSADQTESDQQSNSSTAAVASSSQLIRGATGGDIGGGLTSMGRARKVYPCVLVMHPRHNRRYPNGGVTTMPIRRGLSRARYLGSRRSVFRQMSSQIIDVAAPGRGRNYVNLLNPDTFPSLSHRLEHYLIEHGRYICRRQRRPAPATSSATTTATNAYSASTSAERLLTIRLNNCRLRMHRLLGGRTQYATNANTGPQSLVTRDGAGRFNARHTLCVMLDTLSRFMEVYGTGLVGISGSFRTYLREVIDLSRLLSEVLLLEIVEAIPPPTGMMLDPERENLSQRIDDMCSRMILTRLSSQSQPLTRSLRLMRLNVRFFSHAIHQNQLLEERYATNDHPSTVRCNTPPPLQTNNAPDNSSPELPQSSHLGGGVRRLVQDRGILAQYAQVRQREIQARIDDFAAQEGPEARVEEQTQRDRLARMENFVAHVGQARVELQRRREQRQQQLASAPPVNLLRTPSNMSDLLYQRLEQDRGPATDTDLRSLYQRLRSEQDVRYPHQSAMNTNQPAPATSQSTASPPSSSGSPSPPLFSAATTENQRFLDSLEPAPNNQPHQQHAAAARPTTSAFISPLRRSQQHRRLYLRSAYDHLSLEDVLRHNVEHLNRDRETTNSTQRQDVIDADSNRSSSAERLYPMYFRNNPMWAVPEVQVNNVPVSSTGRDPDYVSPVHRVNVNRNPHARAPPIFSRPRFLHPLYAWPGLNPYPFPEGGSGGGGGGPPDLLDDNPTARAGDQQVYESDIIAAVTPNHRIQVWEFNRVGDGNGIIPNITNALKNIVVNECKIHNDASVDIASDGSVLVTLLPSNSYLNITNRLGIYSLEWETLGQCLYITTFDQNAVSVSLSPLSRHLVVGLASRRVSIMPSEQWTLARIFLLDGRRMAFGRLSLMKEIEQSRDTNFVMSVNCIRWLPTSGQGLVFATNTGQLRILN